MNRFKKIFLLSIVVAVAFNSTVASIYTYAAPVTFDDSSTITITREHVVNKIEKEIYALVTGYALVKCVAHGIRNADSAMRDNGMTWPYIINSDPTGSGDGNNGIFDALYNESASIGGWLHQEILGNYDDDSMSCLEQTSKGDIVNVFADALSGENDAGETLTITRKDVICGPNGGNGGIMRVRDDDYETYLCGSNSGERYTRNSNPACTYNWDDYNYEEGCSETDWGYDSWKTSSPNSGMKWLYAIKDLYDMAKSHYGWSTGFFDNLGMADQYYYTSALSDYLMYYGIRKEVMLQCGTNTSVDGPGLFGDVASGSDTYKMRHITPASKDDVSGNIGGIYKITFPKPSETTDNWAYLFVNEAGLASCGYAIGHMINPNYEDYLAELKKKLNDNCSSAITEFKNTYELSSQAQQKLTDAASDTSTFSNGMYIESIEGANTNVGWRCLTGITNTEGQQLVVDQTDIDTDHDLDDDVQRDPDCYTNAGSLGWILCPVIQAGGDAITKIYDYIDGFMQINTNLFNTSDKSMNGTYIAWNTFRNIANIAFVLIFLFVIFSQLTGVGLDNYGIKKVLPKLIIGAILINVSYIICQLAVDVANIVGYGIKGLFHGMQNQMLQNAGNVGFDLLGDGTGMTKFGSDLIAGASLVVIIVGVIVAASFLASSGGSLLVPILLGLITILISIVSFLVMLAIRQALAVILVVVSPLAFICYMLPNTKAVFKKWFDGMKGMLLAFPICSAIVYGSEMVATILLIANANGGVDGKNVTNFALGLSAAIITVVPIFLVPKAISKSMGAISGTVERISRAGRGMAHRGFNGSALRRNLDYGAKLRRAGLKVAEDGSLRYRSKDGEDHKRAFTKLGKMKLDAQRSEIANEVIARGGAGRFAGDGGLDRLNSRIYSEQEKEEKYKATGRQSQIMLGKVDAVDETGNIIKLRDENGKETTAKIDPNSVDQLQHALTNAMRNNDGDSIKALQNILTQKGDAGREAVRKATRAFEHEVAYTQNADGSYTFDQDKYNNMSEDHKKAIKTAASNIMENHAKDYKDNNRSMYDWAASNSSGVSALEAPEGMADSDKQEWAAQNARTLDGAHGAMKSGSLKQSQLINMDDGELSRLGKSMMDMRKKADNLQAQAEAASNAGDLDSAKKYRYMQSDLENQIAQIESTAQAALDSEALTGAKANRIDDITKMANFSSFQNALDKKSEIEKKPKEYYDPSASWEDIRETIPKIK